MLNYPAQQDRPPHITYKLQAHQTTSRDLYSIAFFSLCHAHNVEVPSSKAGGSTNLEVLWSGSGVITNALACFVDGPASLAMILHNPALVRH